MNLLLLTSSPISQKSSAWLVLKKIILQLNFKNLIIISISPGNRTVDKIDNVQIRIWWSFFRYPIIYKILKRISLNFVNSLYEYSAKKNAKIAGRIIQQEKIDKVWVHVDVLTIRILYLILANQNIKYHLTIFDDPLNDVNLDKFGMDLKTQFVHLLRNSSSLDVPVPELREHYIDHSYIHESLPTAISLSGTFKPKTQLPVVIKEKIKKICITGNIYGIETFNAFCKAIKDVCLNENIHLHIYSNADIIHKLRFRKDYKEILDIIIFKPFVKEEFIIKVLSEYDLLYLSYSFEEKDYYKSKTSFPSKLHNYLASTIPIIIHAPDYSSIYKFATINGIGFIINSLDQIEIREKFKEACRLDNRIIIHNQIENFIQTASKNKHIHALNEVLLS